MGITIAYRGRLADITRVEDFEDRLLDYALETGAQVRVWRTWADDNPERMVRGVILGLAPGQESTSLLLSPEGWLIGLTDIQDAEDGRLKEPPWCWVKTQFGPVEGHVVLVEMLTALKREFLADLEVSDDGGYWETRDLAELVRKQSMTQRAIDGLAEGLGRHGLSREAAEDPNILFRHIERVAEQVHRILRRPAEHPPVEFGDDEDFGRAGDPEAMEKLWDELSKHNRRQQERLERARDEGRSRGLDDETALRDALKDLVPERSGDETERFDEPLRDDEHSPCGESLVGEAEVEGGGLREADADSFGAEEEERHPLLQQAMDLFQRFDSLFRDHDPRFAPLLGTLYQGAGDVVGGLAQALSHRDDDTTGDHGLRVVQLKRALRGAAFARGSLFPLRSTMSAEQFNELFCTLQQMETDIVAELGKVRDLARRFEAR
jgi:hypothetical protein